MKLVRLSHQGKLTAHSAQMSERERGVILYALRLALGQKPTMVADDAEIEGLINDLHGLAKQ